MLKAEYGKWAGNTLISAKKELFTILPGGILEIRGPGQDVVRVCKLRSVRRARRIAELIVLIDYEPISSL